MLYHALMNRQKLLSYSNFKAKLRYNTIINNISTGMLAVFIGICQIHRSTNWAGLKTKTKENKTKKRARSLLGIRELTLTGKLY